MIWLSTVLARVIASVEKEAQQGRKARPTLSSVRERRKGQGGCAPVPPLIVMTKPGPSEAAIKSLVGGDAEVQHGAVQRHLGRVLPSVEATFAVDGRSVKWCRSRASLHDARFIHTHLVHALDGHTLELAHPATTMVGHRQGQALGHLRQLLPQLRAGSCDPCPAGRQFFKARAELKGLEHQVLEDRAGVAGHGRVGAEQDSRCSRCERR